MFSKFSRIKAIAAASAMSMALTFSAPFSAFAATGTVNGSNINVRSDGSTTSSVVGTVNTGDVLTLGDTVQDDQGAVWYQVTLSNGTTGYVRSDFLTINNDDSTDLSGDSSSDGSGTDTSSDASSDASGEGSTSTDAAVAAATTAAEQDTGGYQVVLAPDTETGENTYYLYDNNQGVRMKISDIQALPDEVTAAQQEAQDVRTRYRVFLIALAAACAALAVGCIVLGLRLRDALANGRRERDLTMERRDQRRNNRNADSVEALRRSGRAGTASSPSRTGTGRGRDDAYSSGAYASGAGRRVSRDTDAAGARDVRDVRTSTTSPVRSERRPAARDDDKYTSGRTPDAGTRESSRPVRQVSREEQDYPTRTSRVVRDDERTSRSSRPVREDDDRTSRPARTAYRESDDRPVRSSRPVSQTSGRTSSPDTGARSSRPAAETGTGRTTSGTASRRSSSANDADEDFDYDFLQLDDKDDQ